MSAIKLGVLGNPVTHSRSPEIHHQFAAELGLNISYEKVLVPKGAFVAVAESFLKSGIGFNVTLPCKRDAWEFVDEASERSNHAAAVNTISVTKGGKLRGDNTDGPGLVNDLLLNLGWQIEEKRILVIGAGGAVSGVLGSLLSESPTSVHVANRSYDNALKLEKNFDGITAVKMNAVQECYDLVINGTSAGLANQDLTIPGLLITSETRCYDMTYGPGVTRFNKWCLRQAKCETADGLGMLVEQAALSFGIWFQDIINSSPDTKAVLDSIRNKLNKSR